MIREAERSGMRASGEVPTYEVSERTWLGLDGDMLATYNRLAEEAKKVP